MIVSNIFPVRAKNVQQHVKFVFDDHPSMSVLFHVHARHFSQEWGSHAVDWCTDMCMHIWSES